MGAEEVLSLANGRTGRDLLSQFVLFDDLERFARANDGCYTAIGGEINQAICRDG